MSIPIAIRRILFVGYPALFVVLVVAIIYYNPFIFSVEKTYSGVFRDSFETASFVPDGSNEKWWVANTHSIFSMFPPAPADSGTTEVVDLEGFTLRVTVLGKVSRRGHFGHLGKYDREIRLTKTISVGSPIR